MNENIEMQTDVGTPRPEAESVAPAEAAVGSDTETVTEASAQTGEEKPKKKNVFRRIGGWFKEHRPSKRRLIQLYAALLYNANIKGFITGNIYTGKTKAMCVPGFNCYACPGAIGACPLGALQNALASSGTTAPAYIFGIIILFGLILGRTICGFLCPAGLAQDLAYKIKTPKLKKSKYTRIASYFKYVILAVMIVLIPTLFGTVGSTIPAFCKYICPVGTFGGAVPLLANPNNSNFYAMLGSLFTWKFGVLIVISTASVFIFRFFCRFLCPLGAIYGFFCRIALLGVKLDKNKCIDCGLCLQTCKMDIKHVGDHECIHCGDCLNVCPTKAISWKGSQIFLHPTAAADLEKPEEEQPASLKKLVKSGLAVQSDLPVDDRMPEPAASGAAASAEPAAAAAEATQPSAEEKQRKRNFWLQFAAWALALVVLVGALVYYNFLAPQISVTVYAAGDKCPDFTVSVYNREGVDSFSTIEERGHEVIILNFWYPDCQPCKEELPYFEQFYKDYHDKGVEVLAVETAGYSEKEVRDFVETQNDLLDGTPYRDYTLMFGQHDETLYNMFGGNGAYPMTVIIGSDGYIHEITVTKMSYERLVNLVTPLLAE